MNMNPHVIEVGPTYRQVADDIARLPLVGHYRGEPDLPRWEGRCRVDFGEFICRNAAPARSWAELERRQEEAELAWHRHVGYTGPNVRLGDYYVREVERKGTERRQVVVYEIIGTGRTGQLARTRWERQVRPA